jgi:hypothetical protein
MFVEHLGRHNTACTSYNKFVNADTARADSMRANTVQHIAMNEKSVVLRWGILYVCLMQYLREYI